MDSSNRNDNVPAPPPSLDTNTGNSLSGAMNLAMNAVASDSPGNDDTNQGDVNVASLGSSPAAAPVLPQQQPFLFQGPVGAAGGNLNLAAFPTVLQVPLAQAGGGLAAPIDVNALLAGLVGLQQQQQQQQPQILQTFLSDPPQTASQQILQLLGLQQQAQQRTNTLPTGMSMTAPGSSFQTAAQLQCQPIQQPQQQQSPTFTLPGNTMVPPPPVSDGGSDMTSSLESIVDEGKQRQKSARERGSTILACRARGMAMEHNIHTAFFEISADTAHGTELVCSYPQCQNGGVKFLYCKFCNDAIARRSFRSHHLHNDQNEAASQQSVARRTDPQEQGPPKKRLKTDSSPSSPKEGPSLSNTASSMEIKSIKVKWETLLEERKDLASENDVSPWLMKVLALSEQYAKQCKRMLKSN
mmetsp:Transcript_22585/g.39656  ORF Transcript_22585/g.39656 Transcript_22585/m.39656 type:complete len:412 (+) Transcript_22585:284-1519(+)